MAGRAGHGWKWLEMAANGWKLLEMPGNSWDGCNWLEMAEHLLTCWKLLEMAEDG